MNQYTAWESVPDHLKTKTQLDRLGLRLATDQQPVAVFRSYIRGRSRPTFYDLYDISQATPKQKPTDSQLAHLDSARQKSLALRTCPGCGRTLTTEEYGYRKRNKRLPADGQYYCRFCRDRDQAIAIIYNADFDRRLLNQTRRAWKLPLFKPAPFECTMRWYAQWYGDWSDYHKSYKWQKLNGGHRALGDCLATLEAIKEMAK